MAARDLAYYAAGIGFLTLAKIKHTLLGYSTPKPFDISAIDKCIAYDGHVVDSWLSHLRRYTQDDSFLVGKSVLELGPGSDLGVGILLLTRGAARYNACDVNNLVSNAPDNFYESLFKVLNSRNDCVSIDFVKEQLERLKCGRPSQLNYVVRDDFNLESAFGRNSIELVFSQAAFEHFDDVDATVAQLTSVCKSGAVIISEIDLQTHSRWIRDKDPNNIYRYGEPVYNAFRFRGIPNRVRPYKYEQIFAHYGWKNIDIVPLSKVHARRRIDSGLDNVFRDARNQMEYLSVMFCATRT